jgi:Flp pilus assembly secretin CpaC
MSFLSDIGGQKGKVYLHDPQRKNVIIYVRFLHIFAVLCLVSAACPAEDFAERLFKAGQKAEKAGDKLHAFLLYSKAAALEPANPEFAMRKAMLQADAAMSAETRVDREDLNARFPVGVEALTDREIAEAHIARPPARLQSQEGVKSFDISGDARTVIEKVMGEYGLTAVFESGYQDPAKFRFQLDGARFEDALRTLEVMSNSFLIPVNAHVALVARDNPQKRVELSPAMSMAIPIPERISVQDAQEMAQAVVQMLEIRKFALDPVKRVVYIRDQVPKVLEARAMLETISRGRAQVEVDVDFIEVTKSSALGYGLQLPNSSSIIDFSKAFGNAQSIASNVFTFGGGGTFVGIGIAASTVMATFTKSDSSTILKSQIVALDGQAATLHVGEKYPIVTATYSGGSIGGASSGLVAPPTVNFEDLGLVLKITPSVHEGGEVSLEVDSEFKVLGTADANGNHSISNRKYTGKVRLKADESAVVAGLLDTIDGTTVSGIFGLSSMPVLGRFLRSNTVNHSKDEVLLILRPRIVRLPAWELGSPEIWVGSENRPLTYF